MNQSPQTDEQPEIPTKVPFYLGITFKVLVGLILFDTALILGITIVMNTVGTNMVAQETSRRIEETGNNVVNRLMSRLEKAEALTRAMADAAEALPRDERLVRETIRHMLDFDGDYYVAGGGIWFEPDAFEQGVARRSFFWGRDDQEELRFFDDYNTPGPAYDEVLFERDAAFRARFLHSPGYHNEEWYVVVRHLRKNGRGFWSRSYMDPYSYQPMVTVTVPMRNREGDFIGVATVDLKLEGLHSLMEQWAGNSGGYIFILDRNDTFITFPQPEMAKKYTEDEKGGQVESFMNVSTFAEAHPRFRPVADALADIHEDLIRKSWEDAYYTPALVEMIDRESYQIEKAEADVVTAVLMDPLGKSNSESKLIETFPVRNDLLMDSEAMVSVFHIPHAYWKAVIVKPKAEFTSVAVALRRTLLFWITGIIVLIFILAGTYQYFNVVRPLTYITRKVAVLGNQLQQGKPIDEIEERRIRTRSRSEIGRLARVFNAMTAALVKAHRTLMAYNRGLEEKVEERTKELKASQAIALENAHAAGMAEIATGVIHNIGNVLNSLNITVEDIDRGLKRKRVANFAKAITMLTEHRTDLHVFFETHPKGPIFLDYLDEFSKTMQEEHDKLSSDILEMRQEVNIIREIIKTQHIYAKGIDLYENVDLSEIADDALYLETPALKNKDIQVVRHYDAVPMIRTSKVKLMHIVINLIKNAKEAMLEKPESEHRLTITVRKLGSGRLQLTVEDTGVGIAADVLPKIFSHGFTTKRHGNGFGLHFCGNAAAELGGRLSAESLGPDQGAKFTLELGIAQPFGDQIKEED